RVLCKGAGEAVSAARAAGRERIADDEADIGAGFKRMSAVNNGNTVGKLSHLRQLEVGQRAALADARVAVDGDRGQPADVRKERQSLEPVLLDNAVSHLRQPRG